MLPVFRFSYPSSTLAHHRLQNCASSVKHIHHCLLTFHYAVSGVRSIDQSSISLRSLAFSRLAMLTNSDSTCFQRSWSVCCSDQRVNPSFVTASIAMFHPDESKSVCIPNLSHEFDLNSPSIHAIIRRQSRGAREKRPVTQVRTVWMLDPF